MAGLGRRTHYRKYLTDSVLFDLPEPKSENNEIIAKVVATRGSNQFDLLLSSSSQKKEIVLAILPTKFRKLIWLKRNDYVIVQTIATTTTTTTTTEPSITNTAETKITESEATYDNDKNEVGSSVDVDDGNVNQNDYIPDCNDNKKTNENHSNDDHHEETTTEPTSAKNINNTNNENTTDNNGGIRYMITHILYKDQIKHLISKGLWPINNTDFPIPIASASSFVDSANNNNNDNAIPNAEDDGIVYYQNANENSQLNNIDNAGADFDDNNDVCCDEDNDDDDDENYYYNSDNDDINNNNSNNNNDPLLFVNTNRMKHISLQDSDDSSDEEDK